MNIRKGCIGCMSRRCSRVFHLECIRKEGMLERGMNDGKWVCPRHRCANADKGMCSGDGKVLVSCADCTYALCSTCYQVSCDRNGVKAIVIHQEADDDDLVVDVTNEGMSLTSTTHQLPYSQYNRYWNSEHKTRTQVHIVLDVAIVSWIHIDIVTCFVMYWNVRNNQEMHSRSKIPWTGKHFRHTSMSYRLQWI